MATSDALGLEERARHFATNAHFGQMRKYTNEPYIVHPAEVASIVRSVPHSQEMLAAAWLHDVVEDCGVLPVTIDRDFGPEVGALVRWVTDVSKPSDGNRAKRKEMDRWHTADSPAAAQTVKLADLISNSRSIVQYDPDFAKVYIREKQQLLEVMTLGDRTLHAQALAMVKKAIGETP